MVKRKNIFICPLSWGLGHATRCVPIIKILLKNDCNVYLGASGNAYHYLHSMFPELTIVWFEDYNIKFTRGKHFIAKTLAQTPKIFLRIFLEHYRLKRLIREYNIDAIISDNRFGLWNRKIKSAYITHQIHIKYPGNKVAENLFFRIHRYFIKKYDQCWIPDLAGEFKLATLPMMVKLFV